VPVIVLSDALWRSRFGSDPSIVGAPLTLDGRPFTVAGVMPRSFSYPRGAQFWVTVAHAHVRADYEDVSPDARFPTAVRHPASARAARRRPSRFVGGVRRRADPAG